MSQFSRISKTWPSELLSFILISVYKQSNHNGLILYDGNILLVDSIHHGSENAVSEVG